MEGRFILLSLNPPYITIYFHSLFLHTFFPLIFIWNKLTQVHKKELIFILNVK